MKNSPRNTVIVASFKNKVFKTPVLNEALRLVQRRHPFLHSVLLSLPVVGPYFSVSKAPIFVRELAARDLLGDDAKRTYELQVQGVVDNELNAKFYSPFEDFLGNLVSARAQQLADTELEKSGEIEQGSGITAQNVAQEIPQVPLMRATLVNGGDDMGQSLIITLPQIISDGVSSMNLVKELLEQYVRAEPFVESGASAPDALFLPCMNNLDILYPRRIGGIGATFSNLKAWFKRWRSTFKLKIVDLERFHAWIPNDSRVIRGVKGTISRSTLEALKKRAEEHGVSLGNILGAASAAATHEIFFSDKDSAVLPTSVWVDLRPHFDAPIDPKHLGFLSGILRGHIKSNVGDSIWDIAKQIKDLDSQMPDDAFRSTRWLARHIKFDRNIIASRPPSEYPVGITYNLSPVMIGNLGDVNMPEGLVHNFRMDSLSTYFGQSENTRFTAFTSLPNGDLSVTATFPDLIFKRSDMQEYVNALCQHIQSTADGL